MESSAGTPDSVDRAQHFSWRNSTIVDDTSSSRGVGVQEGETGRGENQETKKEREERERERMKLERF